jgi:hypothetical protein
MIMSAVSAIANERWDEPVLSAPVRGEVEVQLEDLKSELLKPMIAKITDHALLKEALWAANEAAALAWCTVCPLLILPLLLEEKVKEALAKWEIQQRVKRDFFKREARPQLGRSLLSAAA